MEISIERPLPTVWADGSQLVEVVQNLIDNAVRYRGDRPDPRLTISARTVSEADEVLVRFEDRGIGIAPEYRDRVFRLFETFDPKGEGTGIGLALVKRIVENHGGKIWIEDGKGGRGTAFCWTLQLADTPPQSA